MKLGKRATGDSNAESDGRAERGHDSCCVRSASPVSWRGRRGLGREHLGERRKRQRACSVGTTLSNFDRVKPSGNEQTQGEPIIHFEICSQVDAGIHELPFWG